MFDPRDLPAADLPVGGDPWVYAILPREEVSSDSAAPQP